MITVAATCKDKKTLAAALIKEPRGYHKGALIAGAISFSANARRELISARNRLRDKLYDLADVRT